MSRTILRATLLALFLSQTGCFGWMRADAGFTTSTTLSEGRQGGSLGVDFALGDSKSVAIDVGLRGKASKRTGDGSLTVGLLYFGDPNPATFYIMGGAALLQLGSTDGEFSAGAGSPFGEAGIVFAPQGNNDGFLMTIGTRIEYDIRATHQRHEGFWTGNVGFALGGRSR